MAFTDALFDGGATLEGVQARCVPMTCPLEACWARLVNSDRHAGLKPARCSEPLRCAASMPRCAATREPRRPASNGRLLRRSRARLYAGLELSCGHRDAMGAAHGRSTARATCRAAQRRPACAGGRGAGAIRHCSGCGYLANTCAAGPGGRGRRRRGPARHARVHRARLLASCAGSPMTTWKSGPAPAAGGGSAPATADLRHLASGQWRSPRASPLRWDLR